MSVPQPIYSDGETKRSTDGLQTSIASEEDSKESATSGSRKPKREKGRPVVPVTTRLSFDIHPLTIFGILPILRLWLLLFEGIAIAH
jgi:hypothetical protein